MEVGNHDGKRNSTLARVVGKFEKILARTTNQRSLQPYQKSKQWLRNTASKVQRVNRNALFNNNHNVTTRVLPGRMYMYFYDPKTKEDLAILRYISSNFSSRNV